MGNKRSINSLHLFTRRVDSITDQRADGKMLDFLKNDYRWTKSYPLMCRTHEADCDTRQVRA